MFGSFGSGPFLLLHSMRPSVAVVAVVVASERKPLGQQVLTSRDMMMSRLVLVEILVGVVVLVEIEEGNAFLVVVLVVLVADAVVAGVGSVAVGDGQVQRLVAVVVVFAAVGSKKELTSGIAGTVAVVVVVAVAVSGVAVGARSVVGVVAVEDPEAVVVAVVVGVEKIQS